MASEPVELAPPERETYMDVLEEMTSMIDDEDRHPFDYSAEERRRRAAASSY